MAEKTQIHPTVEKETINEIVGLAEAEKRTFSQMVAILLSEAIEGRKVAQNGSGEWSRK